MPNLGTLYESKVNQNLKAAGIQQANFRPAANSNTLPDAEIRIRDTNHKIEIKLDAVHDFGQGSLKYDLDKEKWALAGKSDEAGQQMRDFLNSLHVVELVNKTWGKYGVPRKYTVPANKYTKGDVDHDYKSFKDIKITVPNDSIANYYNTKDTYYMQIGDGFGFYYMGRDIAGLGVPEFSATVQLRMRIKRSHSFPIHSYGFATAIMIKPGSLRRSVKNLDDKEFLKELAAITKK